MNPYDVIKEPITTEKSTMLSDKGKYMFFIQKDATKVDVKKAIKEIYDAETSKVTIINTRPKTRMMKGNNLFEKRKAAKKAVITIKGGKSIDISKFKESKKKK